MGDAVNVFLTGLFGVSIGMSVLYLSIKVTAKAVVKVESKKSAKQEDNK